MKNLSIILFSALLAFAACTKSKEVHPEIGDGNDEIITVGTTGVHVKYARTDHAELSRVVFHYCPADANGNAQQFEAAEMIKRETLFELTLNNLLSDTLYWYYYESFSSGGEASNSSQKTFRTQAFDQPEPPTPPTPPSGAPEGAINGLFTINENGDQVYFSQGNLQYQASTNTWRFAESQLSFVGGADYHTGIEWGNVYVNGVKCDNTLVSPTYNGWIDLFGWGTSGYHDPDDPYNMCFEPWDTINVSGYGPSYNMSSPDLTGASANYDWGVFNAIANGGNEANLWRTLSKNEWDYMLNLRITTSGSRYAKAIVSDCEGIILLPDDWNNTLFDLQGVNAGTAHFNSNEISLSTWVEIFEKAGAVFLSEAGVRGYYQGTIIYQRYDFDVPGFGIAAPMTYWTVSCADPYDAYCLYIHGNSFSFGICLKSNGRSVRLVQDAQ